MRILFLTPQLPFPPRQGTQIRNFHLLKAAAEGGHQVDLLSFARPGETLDENSPLHRLCGQVILVPAPHRRPWDRFRTLATSTDPDMAHRLASERFAATLRALAAKGRYDAIQIEGIEMARYMPVAGAASRDSALLFDDHNAEYLLQGRAALVDTHRPAAWPKAAYSAAQWLKLRRYEARVCALADAVLAVSEADAKALRSLGIPTTPRVVPNGVDTGYYRPCPSAASEPGALLFTGTMDYRPNVDAMGWFVSAALPRVAARKPEARLYIVGRSPAPAVLQLAARNRNVVVTGPVDDVRPYFSRSAAFVVPMRMAGGVRLKILEALAMGLPAVSTTVGAEGTGLADEEEVLLADTAEAFAAAVARLLGDPSLRNRLALAGRQAAEQRFAWDRVAPRLLEVYRDLAGRGAPSPRPDPEGGML